MRGLGGPSRDLMAVGWVGVLLFVLPPPPPETYLSGCLRGPLWRSPVPKHFGLGGRAVGHLVPQQLWTGMHPPPPPPHAPAWRGAEGHRHWKSTEICPTVMKWAQPSSLQAPLLFPCSCTPHPACHHVDPNALPCFWEPRKAWPESELFLQTLEQRPAGKGVSVLLGTWI